MARPRTGGWIRWAGRTGRARATAIVALLVVAGLVPATGAAQTGRSGAPPKYRTACVQKKGSNESVGDLNVSESDVAGRTGRDARPLPRRGTQRDAHR